MPLIALRRDPIVIDWFPCHYGNTFMAPITLITLCQSYTYRASVQLGYPESILANSRYPSLFAQRHGLSSRQTCPSMSISQRWSTSTVTKDKSIPHTLWAVRCLPQKDWYRVRGWRLPHYSWSRGDEEWCTMDHSYRTLCEMKNGDVRRRSRRTALCLITIWCKTDIEQRSCLFSWAVACDPWSRLRPVVGCRVKDCRREERWFMSFVYIVGWRMFAHVRNDESGHSENVICCNVV